MDEMTVLRAEEPAATAAGRPDGVMAAVSSLLDPVGARSLSADEGAAWLRALSVVESMVAAARSRVLGATPGARLKRAAVRSAELVQATGMSGVEARRAVRLSDALAAVPAAADALAEGRMSTGHATALAGGVSWLNRPAAALDVSLVAAAESQSVDEFRATVQEWEQRENGDADGRRLAARQHRQRKASWWTNAEGMVRIEADLAPDAGAVVTGALASISEMLWRAEDERSGDVAVDAGLVRSTGQRNADAMVELARRGTAPDGAGSSAGRPSVDVAVVVGLDRLQVLPPVGSALDASGADRCALSDGTRLSATAARRLACDAGVIPVVLGSAGEVLDVGRRTRVIPRAVRTALVVRDGGCTFPGCDRSEGWCDAHHVRHWADGGATSLDNLVLLCSSHHHAVHDGDWSIVANPDGGWNYRSAHGREIPAGRARNPGRAREPSGQTPGESARSSSAGVPGTTPRAPAGPMASRSP